ncbi:DUF58 domain-containing protein [Chloroflexota bacterium]
MNNKLLILILVPCGLILFALTIRNGRLLLLAIPFLVYLIIGVIQAPSAITLLAHRAIDKSNVIAQEIIEARIVIKNQGNTLVNLCLEDTLFPSMAILDGQAHQRLSLSAGENTEIHYLFKAARGVYSWNTIHARASDPFGLFNLDCDIPAFGEVLVRPAPMQIRSIPLKPRFTLRAAGPISARLAGSGTDFWGIREYRTGDSLRRLNWRLAARHPHKLFTNDYEREEIADFGLILDARKLTNSSTIEEALFEYSVCAAASLSENFIKNGNRVSLLIFGESISSIFPGYGKKHLNLLQRNLARADLGANLPFRYLEYFPTRLFPARSQIVILSPVDSRDLETYARLLAFGYDVLLITPDPVDYTSRMLPQTKINTLASRAARVERVIQLKRLLKLGVKVIDWQVNMPLETIINKNASQLIRSRSI